MVYKILHTGSQQEPLLSLLNSARCLVDYVPLFSYDWLEPVALPLSFEYCIVSSKRSVTYVERNLQRFESTVVYAVGEKTAADLRRVGLAVSYVSEAGVQEILQRIDGRAQGCFIGAKEPSAAMKAHLHSTPSCHHIAVYEQKETPFSGALQGYDVVLCTSANGATALRRRGLAPDTLLVVIGQTTARRAVKEGFRRVVCSHEPTYEALARKAMEVLRRGGLSDDNR